MRHYRSVNRNITSVEVASAVLHDVLEDNDRILDWYKTKAYGFEAYLIYRFGKRVFDIATELKIRPLEDFPVEMMRNASLIGSSNIAICSYLQNTM